MYKLITAISVIFFVFILWIIYLANTGANSIFFDFIHAIPYGDKLGHIGLFGFLTLTAIIAFKFRSVTCGALRLYSGAALVITFVILEEISQAFIPSRTFDLTDLAADAVGIVSAMVIAFLINKYLVKSTN